MKKWQENTDIIFSRYTTDAYLFRLFTGLDNGQFILFLFHVDVLIDGFLDRHSKDVQDLLELDDGNNSVLVHNQVAFELLAWVNPRVNEFMSE